MAKKKSKEISLDDLKKELEEEEDTSGDSDEDLGASEEVEEIKEPEDIEEPEEIGKEPITQNSLQ